LTVSALALSSLQLILVTHVHRLLEEEPRTRPKEKRSPTAKPEEKETKSKVKADT
jgi:hypothetical protein